MSKDYKKEYNSHPWYHRWYNKIADYFPTGFSAGCRNDVVNNKYDKDTDRDNYLKANPTKKRRASFAIAALIILALIAAVILCGVFGKALFLAGGIATAAPMIVSGIGLVGAAAYFVIKSVQNAKSLNKNLKLATKRDKVTELHQQYNDKIKAVNPRRGKLEIGDNRFITKDRLDKIKELANDLFPDDDGKKRIFIGSKLLECLDLKKEQDKVKKAKKGEVVDISAEFKKNFTNSDGEIDEKEVLFASVARGMHHQYKKKKVINENTADKRKRQDENNKDLRRHIRSIVHDFNNLGVSDNVAEMALQSMVKEHYDDPKNTNIIHNYYEEAKAGKITDNSAMNEAMGIQKSHWAGETLQTLFASVPILTTFVNAGRSQGTIDALNETTAKQKEAADLKKIEENISKIDGDRDGKITSTEYKQFATDQDVKIENLDKYMASLDLKEPSATTSISVDDLVSRMAFGDDFSDYLDLMKSKGLTVDPSLFDYNNNTAVCDEKNKTLTITVGSGDNKQTFALDENEIKRFEASTGVKLDRSSTAAFTKAVLGQYKKFATDIKAAGGYNVYKSFFGDDYTQYLGSVRDKTTLDEKLFTVDSKNVSYDTGKGELTMVFGSGDGKKTFVLDEKDIKFFEGKTGLKFDANGDGKISDDERNAFATAVGKKFTEFTKEMKADADSGFKTDDNFLNILKKWYGFSEKSAKTVSGTNTDYAEVTKTDFTEPEYTNYEKLMNEYAYNTFDSLKSLSGPEAKAVIDGFFDTFGLYFSLGDEATLDDYKDLLFASLPDSADSLKDISKYMYCMVQPDPEKAVFPDGTTGSASVFFARAKASIHEMCNSQEMRQAVREIWDIPIEEANDRLQKLEHDAPVWVEMLGSTAKGVNNASKTRSNGEWWELWKGYNSNGRGVLSGDEGSSKTTVVSPKHQYTSTNLTDDSSADISSKLGKMPINDVVSSGGAVRDMNIAAGLGVAAVAGVGLFNGGKAIVSGKKKNNKNPSTTASGNKNPQNSSLSSVLPTQPPSPFQQYAQQNVGGGVNNQQPSVPAGVVGNNSSKQYSLNPALRGVVRRPSRLQQKHAYGSQYNNQQQQKKGGTKSVVSSGSSNFTSRSAQSQPYYRSGN